MPSSRCDGPRWPRIGQRAGAADRQLPLDRRVRHGGSRGEPGGQLPCRRQHQLVVVDEPGEQTQSQRVVRAHRLGEHEQLHGLGVADEVRERPRRAGVGGESDVGERHQERGPRPADPEVRQVGQGRARPGRHPTHGGDDRLGQVRQPLGDRVEVKPDRVQGRAAGLEHGHVLAQVLAGAEGATGPGEHDGAAVAIGLDLGQRVGECLLQGEVQRVERLRPVQGQRGDAVGALDEQRFGHGSGPFSRAVRLSPTAAGSRA
jgi:hypothetical protein